MINTAIVDNTLNIGFLELDQSVGQCAVRSDWHMISKTRSLLSRMQRRFSWTGTIVKDLRIYGVAAVREMVCVPKMQDFVNAYRLS